MRAFTFSNYINAAALRAGFGKLGIEAYTLNGGGCMVPSAPSSPAPGDILAFTEEASLKGSMDRADLTFWPRRFPSELVDKDAFAKLLGTLGIPAVRTGEVEEFGFPKVIKARQSWHEGRQVPRGMVCADEASMRRFLDQAAQNGFGAECFAAQCWHPDGVTNCFSLCGFFDADSPERHVFLTTQKRHCLGGPFGTALVLRTVPTPPELVERATRLFSAISYTGPFELEFLRDGDSGEFLVLECNPRFWMQHGLFVHLFDNALIRLYVGEERVRPTGVVYRDAIWLNAVDFLRALLTRRFVDVRRCLGEVVKGRRDGAAIIVDPPLRLAFRQLIKMTTSRLRARLGLEPAGQPLRQRP